MTKKTKKILIAIILAILAVWAFNSCTDAQITKVGGFGDKYTIEMLNCDGTTGKLIEVTGRLIITRIDDE